MAFVHLMPGGQARAANDRHKKAREADTTVRRHG